VLCAVGDLVEDIVVWLSGPPGEGTDVGVRVFRRRGGSAANVAALCAATGTPARFVGNVGGDDLGDRLVTTLEGLGVDVRVTRGGRTGTIVVLVAKDGERTMLTDRGAALDLDVVDEGWLDGVTVLHLPAYSLTTGHLAVAASELARRARDRGIVVSVDASSVAALEEYGPARFLDLMSELRPRVLLTNDAEARLLGIGDRAPEGVELVVVHRGRGPATAATRDAVVAALPPPSVKDAADTTGAGDAFAAGFLPALQRGETVAAAIAVGHECAVQTLDVPGASVSGRA
jgi:sugar/nucleoside kinase (ribokinase family)